MSRRYAWTRLSPVARQLRAGWEEEIDAGIVSGRLAWVAVVFMVLVFMVRW